MKQLLRKPSARRLSRRLLLLLMLAATSATHLFAQQEDSLRVRPDTLRTRLYHPGPTVAFDSLATLNSELPSLRHLPVEGNIGFLQLVFPDIQMPAANYAYTWQC